MKKLRIALFFSNAFKAPHNNKTNICAPMTLLESIAEQLHARGHTVYFIVPKNSQNKPYYYRTPLLKDFSTNKSLLKLAKEGNRIERIKLLNLYNQSVIQEFLGRQKPLDIFHFHNPEYAVPLLAGAKHSFEPVFTFHDLNTPTYYQSILVLAKQTGINPHVTFLSRRQNSLLTAADTHVIHNAINVSQYAYTDKPKDHLLFAGRMIKEKGVITAIEVAEKLHKKLITAGSIPKDPEQRAYWDQVIEPRMRGSNQVLYKGLVPYDNMRKLYGEAKAFLFPVTWEEAFGLVMIEAMACGTPVVAFKKGAVPEIIKHGKTGFIVKNEKEMVSAIKKIYNMPDREYQEMRRACREHVEQNFSMERMVENYEKLYHDIASKHKKSHAKIRTS